MHVNSLSTTPQSHTKRVMLVFVGALCLLLSLFALLPIQNLFAQEVAGDANAISWRSLGPEGGAVEAVAFDPSNTDVVYVGTRSGGAFRSADGGTTWTAINNNLTAQTVYDIVIHPTNTSILYAGTNGGVFKSTDSGISWTEVVTGLVGTGATAVNSLAIDPNAPDILYAGTRFGEIFKTTDGAANWSEVLNTADQNWGIVIDPTNSDIIYAAMWGGNGMQKSTDGGATWSAINNGLGDTTPKALVIDPTQPETLYVSLNQAGMYKTTDGGANWVEINNGLPDLYSTAVAIDPQNPDTLYLGATSGRGIYKTTDGGANWVQFGTGLNPDASTFYFDALAVDPTDSNVVFAGVFDGVYKTSDAGANWAAVNDGLTAVDIQDVEFHPTVTTTIYAGGNGLHKSVDGGTTWEALTEGLTNPFIQAIAVDTATPATVYVATGGSGVFKSTDSGANWVNSSEGLPFNPQTPELVINPTTPTTLYLASNSGVYKTTDGAANWTLSSTGLPAGSITVLAIDPSTPTTLFAVSSSTGVYKSVDGGASWAASGNGINSDGKFAYSLIVSPSDSNTAYIGTHAGVYRTTDGGANWTQANNGIDFFSRAYGLAVDPVISTTVYAGTRGGGVFITEDGGDNWTAMNDGLGSLLVNDVMVAPWDTDTVYAGTFGSVYQSVPGTNNSTSATAVPGVPATLGLNNGGQSINIDIGAGSLPSGTITTTFTLVQNTTPSNAPGGFQFGGVAFTLDAFQNGELQDDFNFDPNNPVEITIVYTDEDVANLNEDDLNLLFYNEDTGNWESGGITLVSRDEANNTITFAITHLTEFGLFEVSGATIYLPLIVGP